MIGPPPMCMQCTRLRPDAELSCDAYPGGIPDSIVNNEADHRVPQPGDHGLQYDPKPDAEPMPWWPGESDHDEGGES